MNAYSRLILWLVIWLIVAAIIIYKQWQRKASGVGFVLTYVVFWWVLYWTGPFINILPWYHYSNIDINELAFRQSVYGIIAFAIGAIFISPYLKKFLGLSHIGTQSIRIFNSDIPRIYILIGLICYIFLHFPLHGLPTVTALIGAGEQLLVMGLCLEIFRTWQRKRIPTVWLLFTFLLPLFTVVAWGFLGYGLIIFIFVIVFFADLYSRKGRHLAFKRILFICIAVGYLCLSFFVSYMRDRPQIRAAVWGNEPFSSRMTEVLHTIVTMEFFNPFNERHLDYMTQRLNYNYQLGRAVDYIDSGYQNYAVGKTFCDAVVALVPRALWPDKPIVAGGSSLVSTYTGIGFTRETSVGIGIVMELYINFGTAGVFLGFLFIGIILAVFDLKTGYYLNNKNLTAFALWFLPALSFLRLGDSLAVVFSSAGAAFVIAYFIPRSIPKYTILYYLFICTFILFIGAQRYLFPLIYPIFPYLIILSFAFIITLLVKKYLLPILYTKKSLHF